MAISLFFRHFTQQSARCAILIALIISGDRNSVAQATSQDIRGWDATLPLGNTRVIDFMTEEGTWMSLDVSPDGKWILFDLLGHVYRLPEAGGQAECLTQDSGIALNIQPRYSPDGRQIAFVSDRSGQLGLWVMGSDGANPRLVFVDPDTRIRIPKWMPDGRGIVAVRQLRTRRAAFHRTITQLWMFPVNGSPPRPLVADDLAQSHWPSISSDGRFLYYHASYYIGRMLMTYSGHHLRRYELATGDIEQIRPNDSDAVRAAAHIPDSHIRSIYMDPVPEYTAVMAPEVSPDGRFLAFARQMPNKTFRYRGHAYAPRTALWVRDLRSGDERAILDPITTDMSRSHAKYSVDRILPGYGWTPDSKEIVVLEGGKIRRVATETGQVREIPFRARVRRTISGYVRGKTDIDDEGFESKFLKWPAASPDGRSLLFVSMGRVWRMALPNGQPERLTSNSGPAFEMTPSWSPDGSTIAYTTWDDQNRGHLWTMASEGGHARRLTQNAAEYIHPVWSPDGSSVVVTQGKGASVTEDPWGSDPDWSYVKIGVSGGAAPTQISLPRSGKLSRPNFGADGGLYYRTRAREYEMLRKIDPVTEKHEDVILFPFVSWASGNPDYHSVISPDDRFLAFVYDHNVFVQRLVRPWEGPGPQVVVGEPARDIPELQRVPVIGGMHLNWRSSTTIEFISGNTYASYDVEKRRTETVDIRLQVKRDRPTGTVALKGARIITLEGDEVLASGTVVVRRNRILSVGSSGHPKADREINLEGKTIIPGLIDVHAHNSRATAGLVSQHPVGAAVTLAYGVTTTFDPGASLESATPMQELIAAGTVTGSRIFGVGDIVTHIGHHVEFQTVQGARREVERRADWGAIGLKNYTISRRDQQQKLIHAARLHGGLSVTAEGGTLPHVLAMVLDGQTGWEHQLYIFPLYEDLTQFLGRAGVVYSPTVSVCGHWRGAAYHFRGKHNLVEDEKYRLYFPRDHLERAMRRSSNVALENYSFPMVAEGAADVIRAGGYAAIGDHAEQYGLGSHWEVWSYATAMKPLEALKVGSLYGAYFIGLDHELGSIKADKLADLIILNSNPLEDIHNTTDILYVMKNGRLYDGKTLDQVWPDKVPIGPAPWRPDAVPQN